MNQDKLVRIVKKAAPADWIVYPQLGGAFMLNDKDSIPSTSDVDNEFVKTILVNGELGEDIQAVITVVMHFDDETDFGIMADRFENAQFGDYEIDGGCDERKLIINYAIMSFQSSTGDAIQDMNLAIREIEIMTPIVKKAADTKVLQGA